MLFFFTFIVAPIIFDRRMHFELTLRFGRSFEFDLMNLKVEYEPKHKNLVSFVMNTEDTKDNEYFLTSDCLNTRGESTGHKMIILNSYGFNELNYKDENVPYIYKENNKTKVLTAMQTEPENKSNEDMPERSLDESLSHKVVKGIEEFFIDLENLNNKVINNLYDSENRKETIERIIEFLEIQSNGNIVKSDKKSLLFFGENYCETINFFNDLSEKISEAPQEFLYNHFIDYCKEYIDSVLKSNRICNTFDQAKMHNITDIEFCLHCLLTDILNLINYTSNNQEYEYSEFCLVRKDTAFTGLDVLLISLKIVYENACSLVHFDGYQRVNVQDNLRNVLEHRLFVTLDRQELIIILDTNKINYDRIRELKIGFRFGLNEIYEEVAIRV